jgi:hypothetical protein
MRILFNNMKKSMVEVTLTSVITLIVLVILLGLANLVPTNNQYIVRVLDFANANVLVIILFILFFFLGELFFLFGFPFNIPGPIFYAFGGLYMTEFIFHIFLLIDSLIPNRIFDQIMFIRPILILIVFIIILIVGFSKILISKERNENVSRDAREVEWSDVGRELKFAIHNIAQRFNQSSKPIEKEKKEPIKKKRVRKKKSQDI